MAAKGKVAEMPATVRSWAPRPKTTPEKDKGAEMGKALSNAYYAQREEIRSQKYRLEKDGQYYVRPSWKGKMERHRKENPNLYKAIDKA